MLQNNLSLGMALQGSPKDYSQAVFAMRKKGEEADAKKADDEEKKRAKIMEQFTKIDDGKTKMFPWQNSDVQRKTADYYEVIQREAESSNPSITTMAAARTNYLSSLQKTNYDYERYSNLLQNANVLGISQEEAEALRTAPDIETLRNNTGETIFINEQGVPSIRAIKGYKPVSQSAQDFLKINSGVIFNKKNQKEEVINGTLQAFYEIPESVANSYVAQVFNNSQLRDSAIRDYRLFARSNGEQLPEQGSQEELNNVKKYAQDTFSQMAETQMAKVKFGKGATFINNYSPAKEAVDNNFSTTDIEYGEINLKVTDNAGNKWETTTYTVPVMNTKPIDEVLNLSNALDAATGKKTKIKGTTVKRGQLELVPTATKDFEVEVDGFGSFSFKKGEIVPKELMATAENIPNIQFEAKNYTVTNEGESIYIPYNSAEQVKMALEETKSTKGLTEIIKERIEAAKKKALADNIQLNSRMFKNIEDMFGIKRSELLKGKEVPKYDKQNNTIKLDNKGSKSSTTKPNTRVENAKRLGNLMGKK